VLREEDLKGKKLTLILTNYSSSKSATVQQTLSTIRTSFKAEIRAVLGPVIRLKFNRSETVMKGKIEGQYKG
jgi:predicted Mrr-cat superfamily restriction endonuclease